MPGFFYRPISRKEFLSTVTATAGAVILSWDTVIADEPDGAVRVALLSDTHIPADPEDGYNGFRPVENLQKVVPQVVESQPVFAIVDGDAARLDGQEADYRALKDLLIPIAEQTPVCIGLGNHDDRRNFYTVFPAEGDQPVNGKHVTVIEQGDLRFIVLDSLLYVDRVAGLLGQAQRAWLADYLPKHTDKPIVLFVHHSLGDGDGELLDVDRLFRILEPHQHVKAIFYGHSHSYNFKRRKHLHLINLPAVGYNFSNREPVGWIDALFSKTGVGLTLHAIGGNTDGNDQTTRIDWG